MPILNADRYAVLERKLMEAESALFGCRAMLNYCRRLEAEVERTEPDTTTVRLESANPHRKGLYPGQYDNFVEPDENDEQEEACVE